MFAWTPAAGGVVLSIRGDPVALVRKLQALTA